MPNIKNWLSRPLSIKNAAYAMSSADKDTVDLTFYGDVVAEQPIDWWTGEPIEGNFISLDGFLKDLERLNSYKNIVIHMNSYGGDCMAGFTIHNKLREFSRNGKNLICIVDGVAMSSASLIMSACDTVKVNSTSLVMIHKCWTTLLGGYNTDELMKLAEQNAAYDRAIASAYTRKTGLAEDEILSMMGETTYLTGAEAVEKGFADELLEGVEPVQIAASADGHTLYVNGKRLQLAPDMAAPDYIPTRDKVSTASTKDAANNTKQPDNPGNPEGGKVMTREEFKAQYPDMYAEIVAEATANSTQASADAVAAERQRIAGIDEIAGLYSAEAVDSAKYGENACTAGELALRMAKEASKKGVSFMQSVIDDNRASGTQDVPSATAEPTPTDGRHDMTEAEVKDFMANVFKK